jgi:hypothetical protein
VHERGGLKRLPFGLSGHLCRGKPPQLLIYKGQELLGGLRITLSRTVQDDGDLIHE